MTVNIAVGLNVLFCCYFCIFIFTFLYMCFSHLPSSVLEVFYVVSVVDGSIAIRKSVTSSVT